MEEFFKRTWAEVNLDALAHNYNQIRAAVRPQTKICCIVKADAYGHGAPRVAREMQKMGADWFGVSNLEEAIQLRSCGIDRPILILGYTPPEYAEKLSRLSIAQAVLSLDYGKRLSENAVRCGVKVRAHIKVDTGMSRIGFLYQDLERDRFSLNEIEQVCRLPGIDAEGIFTHFAVSDEGQDGEKYTLRQYGCFKEAIEELESRGIHFRLRHCSNSGAVLDYPELQLDMVRPGIILYGLSPSGKMRRPLDLHPVMELKSVISLLKHVPAGTKVSYGCEFVTQRDTVLATVPIGYADGYPRSLHGCADMLVAGKRARVVGRVCMDQLMLDVTEIPDAREGMTATVFGRDGGETIPVDELARLNDTIHYEMVCLVGKRVPRIYLRGGEQVGLLNYICPPDL